MKLKIYDAAKEEEETLILRLVQSAGIIDLVAVDPDGVCLRCLFTFRGDGSVIRHTACRGTGINTGHAGRIMFEDEREDTT